ncbi:hypothetical protein [Nostoc sp. DedSLP04]|nr:hypothetical protein [Nostoc sp. DedSLP04]MDZ8030754.1 hypothetical protein [Nostoc sp. DedSLP04]
MQISSNSSDRCKTQVKTLNYRELDRYIRAIAVLVEDDQIPHNYCTVV